jgi:threonine synthase
LSDLIHLSHPVIYPTLRSWCHHHKSQLLSYWNVNGLEKEIIPYPRHLSAQCTRVSVADGHLACVSFILKKKASRNEIIVAWREFESEPQQLKLPMAPKHPIIYLEDERHPQPKLHRTLEGGMAVSLGRLRECPLFDRKFIILSHNTIREAAGCAILNQSTRTKDVMIQFYSTQDKHIRISLKEAVMTGLAEDGGLFMPDRIPLMPDAFFNRIESLSLREISFEVGKTLLQEAIPLNDLQEIIEKAMNFEVPLVALSNDIYCLELFHGPTLSFKDFGARFMAQLMRYFIQDQEQTMHILVATSGDTGSAVAQAFLDIPGIHVWILYPKGKVSWSQEQQLTTLGHNITALEIDGTFDDCQRLVKQAFSDHHLREKMTLSSANSINIARLIPQSFYYFHAYAQLKEKHAPLVFSVPSGNFGHLTAGLLAKKMGLPITHMVAATNINDIIPKYLHTGIFQPLPSKHTLSNAMDVGNPSNFARLLDLYEHEWTKMSRDIFGVGFTDTETKSAMQDVFAKYGYISDPHGAVAYLGLQSFLFKHPGKFNGIFLETAHPAKFADDVEAITGQQVPIPARLQEVLSKEKRSVILKPDYDDLRSVLLSST